MQDSNPTIIQLAAKTVIRKMRQSSCALISLLVVWCSDISDAFMKNGQGRFISSIRMASTASVPAPNPFDQIVKSFQDLLSPKTKTVKTKQSAVDTTVFDSEISDVKALLVNAAITKKEDGDKVVEALLSLEQLMRSKNKLDEGDVVHTSTTKILHFMRFILLIQLDSEN